MGIQKLLYIFFITMTSGFLWMETRAELFTAVADIEPLLNTHKIVIDDLEEYIAKEEKRLGDFKKHLNLYKKEHIIATEDISGYLGNPINAFTLIKRLTIDLDFIKNNFLPNSDYAKNMYADESNVMYPTLEDLTGAAEALTRLQDTYRLDIGELAQGRLIGTISRGSKDTTASTPMTASDCYELGLTLYNQKYYTKSLLWMMESLRKLKNGDDLYNVLEVDVLEYISFTYYLMGDIYSALNWTKKLLALEPRHSQASSNVISFQETIEEKERKMKRRGETGEEENERDEQSHSSDTVKDDIMAMYEALCRGEIEIPRNMKKKLKCTYLRKNHQFLKLAPIKMEQVYIDPDVFVFYEVMSDKEIEHIKNMAKPRITRAGVNDPDSGMSIAASFRISKSAWISDDQSEVVARITQRTADFTGFSMETAEHLQVANYGIGGHYEPHFDYYRDEDFMFKPATGQRIATVLFYMSDVAQGGATVFTDIGLTVFPIKKSALFWNNLLPTGEGNIATRHAACPVLHGTKWASNKWIHEIGQELIKPCQIEF